MFGFGKRKRQETPREFYSYDLDEVIGMVEVGRAHPSEDTAEILDGLDAGRFTRAMAVRMFRKPFPIFIR